MSRIKYYINIKYRQGRSMRPEINYILGKESGARQGVANED